MSAAGWDRCYSTNDTGNRAAGAATIASPAMRIPPALAMSDNVETPRPLCFCHLDTGPHEGSVVAIPNTETDVPLFICMRDLAHGNTVYRLDRPTDVRDHYSYRWVPSGPNGIPRNETYFP